MNKKERIFLFLVVGLIGIYLIITAVVSIINPYKKTIYLGVGTKVYVNGNNITISDEDIKINKHNVKIYFDKKIINGYVLTEEESSTGYENNLHAYNKNGEYLSFYSSLIAFTKDLPIKFIDIENEYTYDIGLIRKYLIEDDIDMDSVQLDYLIISTFDLDDDEEFESIYSIGLIENNKDYDSKVIMLKDDEYYIISEEMSEYIDDQDVTTLGLLGIMDMNNDNNYEFVIEESYSEYGPNNYYIYNFDGNDFSNIEEDE